MWPWGHLAVGYLLYTAIVHLRHHRKPQEHATVALALGTQFPDIVDKPLAWTFHVLPHGRSLGHSILTAAILVVILRVVFRSQFPPQLTNAFGIGYGSHLLSDALQPILAGEYTALGFLVWPVVPAVEYGTEPSFVGHVLAIEFTPFFLLQFGLVALVATIWLYDSKPGMMTVKRVPQVAYQKLSLNR